MVGLLGGRAERRGATFVWSAKDPGATRDGRSWVGSALIMVVLPVLAGCLGPGRSLDASEKSSDSVTATGLAGVDYRCPAGTSQRRVPEVCIGTLASPTEAWAEAYVAIDRWRPDRLAIGVNAGHLLDAVDSDPSHVGARPFPMDIFITDDGGSSWKRVSVPFIPTPDELVPHGHATIYGDPALTFDTEGRLHVSGMVSRYLNTQLTTPIMRTKTSIFHISTDDLGETWNVPSVLNRESTGDRNWISSGPGGLVSVSWHEPNSGSMIAWSMDRGLTWATTRIEGCQTVSTVAYVHDNGYVACSSTGQASQAAVRAFRFNASSGIALEVAPPGFSGTWPQLAVAADNGIWVAALDDDTVKLSYSYDQGATWMGPMNLVDSAGDLEAMARRPVRWLAADGFGGIHVITGSADSSDTGNNKEIAHFALDGIGRRLVRAQRLTPPPPGSAPEVPSSLGPSPSDHFDGMAFGPEVGLIAWGFGSGIDYTLVELRPPSPPEAAA